jgi:hypothetical protein
MAVLYSHNPEYYEQFMNSLCKLSCRFVFNGVWTTETSSPLVQPEGLQWLRLR